MDYHSKFHPDVQRGLAEGRDDTKPVIDVSSLGAVKPFSSGLSDSSRSVSLQTSIAEEDEEASSSGSESDGSDNSEPFVVNGSGDPKQNKYPHPSLGQMTKTDTTQGSEVLTASLIEIRKHPGTFQPTLPALPRLETAPEAKDAFELRFCAFAPLTLLCASIPLSPVNLPCLFLY